MAMNKLFFLITFLVFSFSSFSQQSKNEAISLGKEDLVEAKKNGVFSFILPEGNTPEKVSENAKYYNMYFIVKFDVDRRDASLRMISNDEKSRRIICRFLSASGVEKVIVDGKVFQIEDYFQTFLK
jgi:hypothetical protein